MKESPKVVAVSAWLERQLGQCVTYTFASTAPCAAAILAALNKMEAAIKVLSVGSTLLVAVTGRTFWICGISLMQAIDESLRKKQQHSEKARETQGGKGHAVDSGGGGGADPVLLGAKTRVRHMMIFTVYMCTSTLALCLFVTFSKYAMAAPLVFVNVPSLLTSFLWNSANIQLHAGRTKLRDEGGCRTSIPKGGFPAGSKPKYCVVKVAPAIESVSAP